MQVIQSTTSSKTVELIRDFLQKHNSGVLSTSDLAGNPHGAVVYFAIDDLFSITFATKTETQKYQNLEQNSQVAFVCYDEAAQTTVQVVGQAKKITDQFEHQHVLNNMYRFSGTISKVNTPPAERIEAGDYAAFKIVPEVIKMGMYLRQNDGAEKEVYEVITFTPNEKEAE